MHFLLCFSLPTAPVGQALYRLLLIEAFRPDRLISAAHIFVDAVMGSNFMQSAEHKYNLAEIVESEVGIPAAHINFSGLRTCVNFFSSQCVLFINLLKNF